MGKDRPAKPAAGARHGRRRPPSVTDDLKALRQAAAGLMYPSESDAPFDVFTWPAGAGGTAREQVVARTKPGEPIEEVPVGAFFGELEDTDDAARFRALRAALEATLTDVRVFRVGRLKVDVYLIGRTAGGSVAGLHTTSVET